MKQFFKSVAFAANGIRLAVAGQRNMKIHLTVAMLVVVAGLYYNISSSDWCIVFLAIGLVLTAEMVNSSIEALVDLLEPRLHPLAGKVKDLAAGGVLIAAVCSIGIGLVVFLKYLPS